MPFESSVGFENLFKQLTCEWTEYLQGFVLQIRRLKEGSCAPLSGTLEQCGIGEEATKPEDLISGLATQ